MKIAGIKPRTIIIIGAFMFFAGVPWSFMGINYVYSWDDLGIPTTPEQRYYYGILVPLYTVFLYGGIAGMVTGSILWPIKSRKQSEPATISSAG